MEGREGEGGERGGMGGGGKKERETNREESMREIGRGKK